MAVCFPVYSIYQGYLMFVNRIYRVTYPIYRALRFAAYLIALVVTLPIRIITYLVTRTEVLLNNFFVTIVIIGVALGLLSLFLEQYPLDYLQSLVYNSTSLLFKNQTTNEQLI
jgi:hypothetical protein